MKNDLIETVKFCFTSKVINQISLLVDETPTGVERALSKSVPLILNGFLSQVERGAAPATLLALVRDADTAEVLALLAHPEDSSWDGQSTDLLLDLLGNAYRGTVNQIAVEAHIQPTASGTLLQVAATAVLGVLGRFAVENSLTPTEFINWLQSQKDAIGAAMLPQPRPTGPNTPADASSEAALRQPAAMPPRMVSAPIRPAVSRYDLAAGLPAAPPPSGSAGLRWQWGLLLLLAVGLGYSFGRKDADDTSFERLPLPAAPPAAVAPAPPAPVAVAPAPVAPLTPVPPAAAPAVKTIIIRTVMMPAAPTAAEPETRSTAERHATAARAEAATGSYDPARDVYVYDTGRPTTLTLDSSGGTANVGTGSTEVRLRNFLATPSVQVDSVNRNKGWIDFDRVYFEPGKTTLTPESMQQLVNVGRLLRTFPDAIVKIGGYSDSSGVAQQDLRFSEARARAVMTVLSHQGVRISRLFAQGYGARYAVMPNATLAGRAQNRRVSIRVLRK